MSGVFDFSTVKVGLISFARSFFDTEYAVKILNATNDALCAQGFRVETNTNLVVSSESAQEAIKWIKTICPGVLVIQIGTFVDASLVMEVVKGLNIPLLLWAVREPSAGNAGRLRLNSFCGLNLAAYALVHSGIPFEHVFGDPDESQTLEKASAFLKGNVVCESLSNTKIIAFGNSPKGYYPSTFDPLYLKGTWGLDVIQISLDNIFSKALEMSAGKVAELQKELSLSLPNLNDIPADAVDKSIRGYLALKEVLQDTGAAALAVECWPDFMTKFGGAACFALGRLNAEGFPAACEAEVNGASLLLMLQRLSGQPPYFGDLVHINEERQSVVFWHCGFGAPCQASALSGIRAGLHPNRKMGLIHEFSLKGGGPVTVAQFGKRPGKNGYRMLIAKGEAVEAPLWFQGTSMEVKLDIPPLEMFDAVVKNGFGHHYALAYGDVEKELRAICREKDVEIVKL